MQVSDQPVGEAVAPAVHRDALAARPGIAQHRGSADVLHLVAHVQLAQGIDARSLVGQSIKRRGAHRGAP